MRKRTPTALIDLDSDAEKKTATRQSDRLRDAAENLKRMREAIAPFAKPKPPTTTSTAGKWVEGSALASRLPGSHAGLLPNR